MNKTARIVFENILSGNIDEETGLKILESLKSGNNGQCHDIAIIGVSAKFPKADNADAFWENIRQGVDCVTEFPYSRRKDTDKYLHTTGKAGSRIEYFDGAYFDEIDKFDCEFFRISPKEARLMSPYQRMFLEGVWSLIEDAGYGGNRIKGSNTGIYIGYSGDSFDDYKSFIMAFEPESMSTAFVGNMSAVLSGRVSHMLDLKGPNILIDTACSASLCAVNLACQAIRNGECEMAIAGGIRLIFLRIKGILDVGIESSVNRARTFDDSSDGTGAGEGMGMVLLKPLEKAIRDGDNIYAVIKGIAMNQDGNSIGLTAPNVAAQESLITSAWKDAEINPETISYIEAHGTGTRLGDPIEIDGIQRAFRRYTSRKQFCAIGSVKTNIGHLDGSAGIAGLLKAVLALKHRQIPPLVHFRKPNRNINFEDSPVYVSNKLLPWETDGFPLRCGVSSFGLSGTNCHIILEEPLETKKEIIENTEPQLFTLSALGEDSLKQLVQEYNKFLKLGKEDIRHICYTANACRGHYSHRLALIVTDTDDLKNKIGIISSKHWNQVDEKWFFYGIHKEVTGIKELREDGELTGAEKEKINCIADEKLEDFKSMVNKDHELLESICKLYVSGADINWDYLYENAKNKKVSLPVYQFAKKRFWVRMPENIDIQYNESHDISSGSTNIAQASMIDVGLEGKKDGKYTATEMKIAQVWGDVLGFTRINVYDDFYALGGDSILAMKIVNSIKRIMHIDIETADIFKYPTIFELSQYISEKSLENRVDNLEYTPLRLIEEADYYPVSSAQRRLYIMNYMDGVDTAYNEPGVTVIEGKLDKERLERAFQLVIARHEALRTSFKLIDGVPMQKIHKTIDFTIDYYKTDENDSERIISSFIKPFDLEKAPLIRVVLMEVEEEKHLLAFDVHHIVSDGTSVNTIVLDLASFYEGKNLPPLKFQYKDFAVWQNNLLNSDIVKRQEEYWLKTFSGDIPVLEMPTDYPRPEMQSFEGDIIRDKLDSGLTAELNRLAEKEKVTMNMLLLSAYNVLLSKYSGQEDIIVGSAVAGRNNPDVENIVGMFVNTLAIRNYPKGNKIFSLFMHEVKDNVLQCHSNQDYQFEELVEKLNLPEDRSRNPLFGTMFIMQNIGLPEINMNGLKFSMKDFERRSSKFDFKLEAFEANGAINFNFDYCKKLFKKSTMEKFLSDYISVLRYIAENPDTAIKNIEIESSLIIPKAVSVNMDFNF